MGVTDDVARQVDRLEHGFANWSLAESLHAVEGLRMTALAHGRRPAARIAAALSDRLWREGRGAALGEWLDRFHQALGDDAPRRPAAAEIARRAA